MNQHIQAQIANMITFSKAFLSSCELAAKEDDGRISPGEQKLIREITTATERYIGKLKKLQ